MDIFTMKLQLLREGYKRLLDKAGERIAKATYKPQVRILCKEYGMNFEEVWYED